jgi:hypothetical protein
MNAASSLGGLRPVSALAGQALERSAGSDSNARVRWHAKSILVKYRLAGYAPGSKGEPPLAGGPQTSEPPLLDAAVMSQPRKAPPGTSPPAPFPTGRVPANPASMPKTTAPPLSQEDALEFRPSTGRPSARGPTFSTAVPQRPTQTAPQPLPMVESEGPSLTPLAPVAPPPAPR